jgi:hypothetical protein
LGLIVVALPPSKPGEGTKSGLSSNLMVEVEEKLAEVVYYLAFSL